MIVIDYCNLSAGQYNGMTAPEYDTMLDCDGDDEGHGGRTSFSHVRRDLWPILIPFLDDEELERLQNGEML